MVAVILAAFSRRQEATSVGLAAFGHPKPHLASVRAPCRVKSAPSGHTARVAPFLDALTFNVCDLSKNSDYQLAYPPPQGAEAPHIKGDAHIEQPPHGGLHVKRVAPQPIERIDVDRVALTHVGQQGTEALALRSRRATTYALVRELIIEPAVSKDM